MGFLIVLDFIFTCTLCALIKTFTGSGLAVELHTGKKVNLNLTYKSNMLWKISVDFWSGHRTHTQLMIGGCKTGRDLICTHIF